MFDLGIVNGKIVDSEKVYLGNIYISDGKIKCITNVDVQMDAEKIIDATGKLLFPGVIDAHLHIGEYKAEYEEMDTSTAAAVAGGVTCCVDMPVNTKSMSIIDTDIFEEKRKHLSEKSYMDYSMWGAFVPEHFGDLKGMHDMGAAAFKCFMTGASNGFTAPTMADIRDGMNAVKEFDGLIGFHCENKDMIDAGLQKMKDEKLNTRQAFLDSRPLSAEIIAVRDVIELARETGCKVHICHVSHPTVAQIIEEAQMEGVDITAETCTHYLVFSEEDLLAKGCLYKCAPPLREKGAADGLWEYVQKGVLGCVVSDHSAGLPEDRDDSKKPVYELGNGISSVQTMLQVFYDNAVNKRGKSPTLIAKVMSENPARRFGLYGRKGAIKVDFDADIVMIDPEKDWKITNESLLYKQQISAFVGLEGTGLPVMTMIRGRVVSENGEVLASEGSGEFINPLEINYCDNSQRRYIV